MDFIRTLIRFVTYQFRYVTSLGRLFKLNKLKKFLGVKPGKSLLSFSLAGRIGLLTFLFLVICLITFYVTVDQTQGAGPTRLLFEAKYIAVIILLAIAIPIVVYKTLKLWLEGEASQFPDIEEAWSEAMAELEAQNIDLQQVPLFLVLGAPNETQAQAMFDASGLDLLVSGTPHGNAPLHLFANAEAAYLVSTQASCLSLLTSVARKSNIQAPIGAAPTADPRPPRDITRTMVVGEDEDARAAESPPDAQRMPDIRGTMEVSQVRDTMMPGGGGGSGAASGGASEQQINVNKADRELQQRRLDYLCRLIVRGRKPFCAINGILNLLSYKVLESDSGTGEMSVAVGSDMRVTREVFKLRFPITALVVGLEEELGFQELVRRVGHADAAGRRFGKGHDVWKAPIPEQMEALCAHACGAFEDWSYSLFRKEDALRKKTGNERLYSLLCKIRGRVQIHLEKVLVDGFGYDPDVYPDSVPPLFGGCYFAASGQREDRRAFVKGVLVDKLATEEAELEWTERALAEDRKHHRLARLAIGIDAVLAIVLVVFVYAWWQN